MNSRTLLWVALAVLATLVSLLPVFFQFPAPGQSEGPIVANLMFYGAAVLAALACYFFDHTRDRKEKLDAILLCLALSLLTNYLHLWLIDNATNVWGPNLGVQNRMHEAVVALRPEALPHSYRFLPNSIIRLLEQVTGDYESARDTYRSFFGVLLFYALYRFARQHLLQGGAILTLALWAAVVPVSFRYYAGQATDPMSHLSFLLAFIFLETGQFVPLLLTLLVGSLAKETVLALAGYYVLFRRRDPHFTLKVGALVIGGAVFYFGARLLVLRAPPGYAQISGVSYEHLWENWEDYRRWFAPFLFTVGIFLPFVVLGWRTAPRVLRRLVLFLFPVLFFSSLIFSWLREGRNFMPLCAVLIVLTVHYLLPQQRLAARLDQE